MAIWTFIQRKKRHPYTFEIASRVQIHSPWLLLTNYIAHKRALSLPKNKPFIDCNMIDNQLKSLRNM